MRDCTARDVEPAVALDILDPAIAPDYCPIDR
jgi:hypothetical protein